MQSQVGLMDGVRDPGASLVPAWLRAGRHDLSKIQVKANVQALLGELFGGLSNRAMASKVLHPQDHAGIWCPPEHWLGGGRPGKDASSVGPHEKVCCEAASNRQQAVGTLFICPGLMTRWKVIQGTHPGQWWSRILVHVVGTVRAWLPPHLGQLQSMKSMGTQGQVL